MVVGADWITLVIPVVASFQLNGEADDLKSDSISQSDRDGLESMGKRDLGKALLVKSNITVGWRF